MCKQYLCSDHSLAIYLLPRFYQVRGDDLFTNLLKPTFLIHPNNQQNHTKKSRFDYYQIVGNAASALGEYKYQ